MRPGYNGWTESKAPASQQLPHQSKVWWHALPCLVQQPRRLDGPASVPWQLPHLQCHRKLQSQICVTGCICEQGGSRSLALAPTATQAVSARWCTDTTARQECASTLSAACNHSPAATHLPTATHFMVPARW